jgi:FdhD protein
LLIVAEDVGRHNGMDKACGAAMLQRIPAGGRLLLTTGRISSELLRKGAHMRTPVMVSRTSATTPAVDLARRLNIPLMGDVRSNSFFVYSHPARLVSSDPASTCPRQA